MFSSYLAEREAGAGGPEDRFIHPSMPSFNKCLLSLYSVADDALGARDIGMPKSTALLPSVGMLQELFPGVSEPGSDDGEYSSKVQC